MIRKAIAKFIFPLSLLSILSCTGNPFTLDKGGHVRQMAFVPAATIVRGEGYKILGREEGETSTFFLFGLFPLTNPLNIEYAMSQAVQKIDGGQSLVNVGIWHETHYYYPIGTVSVLKVEGDVVNFSSVDRPLFEDKEKKGSKVKIGNLPKTNSGGLTVGGKKKKSGGGGITVGGTK